MNKKDILELKKRFKKEKCTFTRISGCFVNSEKNIVLELNESFLNLEESDYFKYLEIAKKILSGTIGNNLLELNFLDPHGPASEKQLSLIDLKKSKLKDQELTNSFFQSIIESYDYSENYLILFFHDVYDIITKTSDNLKIDESEEVFEYVICAICPISLSPPGLSYYEEENIIKSRFRDWVVAPPINGFLYPAFIDRSPDVNSLTYYTKNPKDIHPEFIVDGLGCTPRETASLQKEKFQFLMKDSISDDEDEADEIYMEIQNNLYNLVEDHRATSDDADEIQSIKLTQDNLQEILVESGIDEETLGQVGKFYQDNFDTDLPSAENLLDKKILQINEQKKKEKSLQKQVDFLKDKLENTSMLNNQDDEYDIIIKSKPEKIDLIKSEIIDGQKYIMIPVTEDELTKISEI